ncbi:MAG: hypothetical protein J6S82_00680 [Bacteroidales bacterium]|nr:hypothetical protein [Bacteroidales bacterium]
MTSDDKNPAAKIGKKTTGKAPAVPCRINKTMLKKVGRKAAEFRARGLILRK